MAKYKFKLQTVGYDIRKFEAQKEFTCRKCSHRYGYKLLCGSSTLDNFSGCPKCYVKFRKTMYEKEAMEANEAVHKKTMLSYRK